MLHRNFDFFYYFTCLQILFNDCSASTNSASVATSPSSWALSVVKAPAALKWVFTRITPETASSI